MESWADYSRHETGFKTLFYIPSIQNDHNAIMTGYKKSRHNIFSNLS